MSRLYLVVMFAAFAADGAGAMHSPMVSTQYVPLIDGARYQALALETVTPPAGTFDNALNVREQRGPGNVRDVWYAPGAGMVRWVDGPEEALLSSLVQPTGPVAPVARAVEYSRARIDR